MNYFRQLLARGDVRLFVLYVIYAGLATVVDVGLLWVFTALLGIYYLLSAALSYCAGMLTNFLLNKFFNFRNRSQQLAAQFGVFAAVALVGLALNQLVIFSLVEWFHIWYIGAKLVSVVIVALWSFWGHKHFTFGWFVE